MTLIAISLCRPPLGYNITGKISSHHPGIPRTADRLDNRLKNPRFKLIKVAAAQQLHDSGEVLVGRDHCLRMVITPLFFHLGCGQTEEEEILPSHLFTDLDIGSIQSADSQRAVHHKFHVAGPGSLFSGGGNLLRQVGSRTNHLHGRNPVVGQKSDLEQIADIRVVVDHPGNIIDQFDNRLGHGVTGGRLAADQHTARRPIYNIPPLDPVIKMNNMENVEQLAFVLVNPLDLHIEHGLRIEINTAVGLDQLSQTQLVFIFDLLPALLESPIPGQLFELLQLHQIDHPSVADAVADQPTQPLVAPSQPAALGDTVGLVVELLRPQLVKITKQPRLQQCGMQFGNAVDREAADDRQVGHPHLRLGPFLNDRHAPLSLHIAWPAVSHLLEEAGVDLVDDIEQPRQQLLKHPHRPFFQRFRQQGVISVSHSAAGNLPGFVPAQPLFIQQQAHQFGDRATGMGVVELKTVFLSKTTELGTFGCHPLFQYILQAGRGEKVLLAQTQIFTVFTGVIRIEHHGDLLRRIFCCH